MKTYTRILDVLHCRDGKFIHVKDMLELSSKPFNSEEGMIETLTEDNTNDILYAMLSDDKMVSIDLSDQLNRDRANVDSYNYRKAMLDAVVNSWAVYKYGTKYVNFEVYDD